MFHSSSIMLCCAIFLSLPLLSTTASLEGDLISTLMSSYNRLSVPGGLHRIPPLTIVVGITPLQIIEVNEKSQLLTTSVWLDLRWVDEGLRWSASLWGNITHLRIPPHLLWHPDLMIYNSAEDGRLPSSSEKTSSVNMHVGQDGTVIFVPPMIIKSTCPMDVTWFPFDEQSCRIVVGSWTFSGFEVDLALSERRLLEEYTPNGEWKLIGIEGQRSVRTYSCCSEPYPKITFTLHLKRQSMYYFFSLIVPCALIGFLAVLGFTLPPDSGEKLSLGVTVLFSLIVFLNQISTSMPANSGGVPLLGTFFNCVMFMIACSVLSTIVVNLQLRGGPPGKMGWLGERVLLHWLPRCMRMKRRCLGGVGVEPAESGNGNGTKGAFEEALRRLGNEQDAELRRKWMFAACVVERAALFASIAFALISTIILLISSSSTIA